MNEVNFSVLGLLPPLKKEIMMPITMLAECFVTGTLLKQSPH